MKRTHGFTLVELLVVIAIIALLSSVVLASLSTARMKARDARRISDIGQIAMALEMYFDSTGDYPCPAGGCNVSAYNLSYINADWTAFQTTLSQYIPELPKDPINTNCAPWFANCYSYGYGDVSTTSRKTYDLWANLEVANNPQSCKFMKNRYGAAYGACGGVNGCGLCAESDPPYATIYLSTMIGPSH